MQDNFEMKGHLKIYNARTNELLVDKPNLIVNTGKNLVRDYLNGNSLTDYLKSFAVGTGTASPAATDTALGSAILYDGANTYKEWQDFTNLPKQTTYIGFLSSQQANGNDITEFGAFTGTGGTAGTMFNRITFNAITKSTSVELRLEYTLKI